MAEGYIGIKNGVAASQKPEGPPRNIPQNHGIRLRVSSLASVSWPLFLARFVSNLPGTQTARSSQTR